jgi:hypothetical protein
MTVMSQVRTRRAALVSAAAVALLVVVPAGTAAAATTVSVTPDTGLTAAQTVTVAVSNAAPNQTAGAAQCRAGGNPLGSGCAGISPSTTGSDAQGHFTVSMTVHRFIAVDPTPNGLGTIVDCATAAGTCTVVGGTIDGTTSSHPLAFAPGPPPTPPTAAHVTASPTSALVDGQTVTFQGSAFTPGAPVLTQLCATAASVCTSFGPTYTDGSGAFSVLLPVRTTVGGSSCRTSGPCVLRATDITGVQRSSSALSFTAPIPRTVTVEPSSGLADGQTVTVHGTGFLANTETGVGQCPAGTTGGDCVVLALFNADGQGAFTTTIQVQQHLAVNGGTIDCASSASACVVAAAAATDIGGTLTVAPIRFGFPSPRSTSECKHGGWRQLADRKGRPFTNQGGCVSWVASHPHR